MAPGDRDSFLLAVCRSRTPRECDGPHIYAADWGPQTHARDGSGSCGAVFVISARQPSAGKAAARPSCKRRGSKNQILTLNQGTEMVFIVAQPQSSIPDFLHTELPRALEVTGAGLEDGLRRELSHARRGRSMTAAVAFHGNVRSVTLRA